MYLEKDMTRVLVIADNSGRPSHKCAISWIWFPDCR